jgi:hypothetical protein
MTLAPGGHMLRGSTRASTGEEQETRMQQGSGAQWGFGGHIRTYDLGKSLAGELQLACVRSWATAPVGTRNTHQR